MQAKAGFFKVFICQSAGFIALIGLSWLNECVGLRALVLGHQPYIPDFRESALEMLFALTVWLLVLGATRRIMARVHQLEGVTRVCAWCHRVGTDGRWVAVEEFMASKLDVSTTHGMCEDCVVKQEALMEAELKPGPSPAGGPAGHVRIRPSDA